MSLYTWAIRPLTHTPTLFRSLNYRRSSVQNWTIKKAHTGQTPPQPQLATCYVEAGEKFRESRGGETHGEDVSKLGGGRDMEDPNIGDSDPIANEACSDRLAHRSRQGRYRRCLSPPCPDHLPVC